MSHQPFVFALLALACYRLTRLVVSDSISDSAREWLRQKSLQSMVRVEPFSGKIVDRKDLPRDGSFARLLFELVTCAWCVSIWAAATCVLLAKYQWPWFQFVAYGLALSSVTGLIAERA